jgi:hypothetical protein
MDCKRYRQTMLLVFINQHGAYKNNPRVLCPPFGELNIGPMSLNMVLYYSV